MRQIFLLFIILLVMLVPLSCLAEDTENTSTKTVPARVVREYTDYEVNADGSFVATIERAFLVLDTSAVDTLGQLPYSIQEGASELEILEAYTLKPNGERLHVPKDKMVLQVPRLFSEASTTKHMAITFSDVVAGDQVVYRARSIVRKPSFSRHFTATSFFPKSKIFDDVRISVKYPKTYPLYFEEREIQKPVTRNVGDFIVKEWKYKSEQSITEEVVAVDPLDRDPRLIISSFREWADVARAYQSQAGDKSAVTGEVRRLAEEITQGITDKRKQAEAIYNWVLKYIKYFRAVADSGVVPHSSDFIIDQFTGDCKDHATLLEALLAAKGIASTPVLVRAGNSFVLPELPTLSYFNHLINYVPSLNLYLDSTLGILPFGELSYFESDKPVLHTKDAEIRRTPPLTADRDVHETVLQLEADEEGNVSGTEFVKTPFDKQGYSAYVNWPKVSSPGLVRIPARVFTAEAIKDVLDKADEPPAKVNHVCIAGTLREETELRLPAAIKVKMLPKNVEFSNSVASYQASYTRDGQTVKIVRKLIKRFPRGFCTPEESAAFRDVAVVVKNDIDARVLIQ